MVVAVRECTASPGSNREMSCLLRVLSGVAQPRVAAADVPAVQAYPQDFARPALLASFGSRGGRLGDLPQVLAAWPVEDQPSHRRGRGSTHLAHALSICTPRQNATRSLILRAGGEGCA